MGDIDSIWNSPVVGAYLLWKFSCGYCNKYPESGKVLSKVAPAPHMAWAFPALAILMQPKFSNYIKEKYDTLEQWVRFFVAESHRNVFGSLTKDIIFRKQMILESIDMAYTTHLLGGTAERWVMKPLLEEEVKDMQSYSKRFRGDLGKKAELLGMWFSFEEPSKISRLLEVTFA